MIDICIALDQSVSPHTGVRAIQNTGVFLQAVFQTPRPHSFFLDREICVLSCKQRNFAVNETWLTARFESFTINRHKFRS